MKKIAVFTGTRAEYGILLPVMEAIDKSPNLDLSILASGTHLEGTFGGTLEEIYKDFPKEKVHAYSIGASKNTRADKLGEMEICMNRTGQALQELDTDILLFLGDRYETFAAATSAVVLGIPMAHVHGGDKTKAGLDESFRHALTKLSNIHFAATEKSAERIRRMGENPDFIFNVGGPSLDTILGKELMEREEILQRLDLDPNKQVVLGVQHSVTSQIDQAEDQIKNTLEALCTYKDLQIVFIYPNSDPGNLEIRNELEKRESDPRFSLYKSLSHIEYLSLLKHCDTLIGNSSSGVIDTSGFGTPTINIGIRQEGRERGFNVIDSTHDIESIKAALESTLYDDEFRNKARTVKSPYGNGKAGQKIAKILSEIKINEDLLQKQIVY